MARSRGKIPFMPQPKGSTPAYRHEGIYFEQSPKRKGSDEDHLSLPSLNQPKDTNPKDTRPHISSAYKITLLPSTSVSIAEPSSQHPEAGERMEYILAHASLHIYKIKA